MYNSNYNGTNNQTSYYARENNLMYRVYGWMCYALALTAAMAFGLSTSVSFNYFLAKNPASVWVLLLAQIGLVFILTAFLQRMNFVVAFALFSLYAASVGVTLSSLFLVYTHASIGLTFAVTAGMFGAMALYGYYTKANLSAIGSYAMMALVGLILAGLANMFFKSPGFQYIISAAGVMLFTLLTAYDVQRIKLMTEEMQADGQTMAKVSIFGALVLYLDFINLFLYLLQIMGKRKD